jgi:transcriptional regulator with XRE-family HTH domain
VKASSQQRLRAWLKAARRTQRSLAEELGVSPPYIAMLIAGERTPSLPVAKRLQEITGIPATQFVKAIGHTSKQRIA